VYGWQGHRSHCPPAANGGKQTREICAARSKVEVARIAGVTGSWKLFKLCETGNAREIELAMASPGAILWAPLDDSFRANALWVRVVP
jgi:hypothetical protein